MFVGLFSYVWGLATLRLGVNETYVSGLISLTFGG